MNMTDPVADMITRIRNGVRAKLPRVDVPASKLKMGVASVLKGEGYIQDYQVGVMSKDEQGHPVFQPVEAEIGDGGQEDENFAHHHEEEGEQQKLARQPLEEARCPARRWLGWFRHLGGTLSPGPG